MASSLASGTSSSRCSGYKGKASGLVLLALVVVAAIVGGVLDPRAGRRNKHLEPVSASTLHSPELATITNALLIANTPGKTATTTTDKAAAAGEANTTTATNDDTTVTAVPANSNKGFFASLMAGGVGNSNNNNAVAPWGRLAGVGAVVCYPKDGADLQTMASDRTSCTVIVLRASSQQPYNITKTLNITTTKILIGNPIDLPLIKGGSKQLQRLFDVFAGGRLDVRFVQLQRAGPQRLDGGVLRLFVGSTGRVFVGGTFVATGSVFSQNAQTVENFLENIEDIPWNGRIRIFGGFFLVYGGNIILNGCIMYRFNPLGNPIINNIQIGRDILVLAGNCVLTGFFNLNAFTMASSINVGNILAVFGGTASWIGGGSYATAVLNGQFGVGQIMFVGGGTLVTVGMDNMGAMMALIRAGMGQFATGGGVLVHIGHKHVRTWGLGAVFNAGQTHAVGGGIYHMLGSIINTATLNFVFAGAGGQTFVGGGHLGWIGVTATRSTLTSSQHGVGMQWYNGGGNIVFVALPGTSATMISVRFIAGGEQFLGGGMSTWINCKRANVQLVQAFFGQGTSIFIGGGAALFINARAKSKRLVYFTPFPNTTASVFVAGTQVKGANANKNIFVNKDGITFLPPTTNKNKTRHHQVLQRHLNQRRRLVTSTTTSTSSDSASESLVSGLTFEDYPSSLTLIASSFDTFTGGKYHIAPGAITAKELVTTLRTFDELDKWVDKFLEEKDDMQVTADSDGNCPILAHNTISVSKNTDCILCSSPHSKEMLGPGQCVSSDACGDGTASPSDAFAKARSAFPSAEHSDSVPAEAAGLVAATTNTDGSLKLPDLFFLWHDLVIYCQGKDVTGACVSEPELKEAINQQLAPLEGYAVTAASMALPGAVSDVVTSEFVDPHTDVEPLGAAAAATCVNGFRFNVYATTYDDKVQALLEAGFRAIAQNPQELLTKIQNVIPNGPEVVCGLTIKKKAGLAYPPVERMEPYQPKGLGLVGPSLLLGSSSSITMIDHVVAGETYTLFLQNFPVGCKVEVHLFQGVEKAATLLVDTIQSFDEDGLTEVLWTVPKSEGLEKVDDLFFLKAEIVPGGAVFATSQAFSIVAEPLKRFRR